MRLLFPLLLLPLLTACPDRRDPDPVAAATPAELGARVSLRATAQRIGETTLSDSARIVRVVPEPDGDAVAFIFTDPAHQVQAGLAIHDARMETAQLLWPDLVTDVWWTDDHTVAFTTETGAGVRVVVNVHEAALQAVEAGAIARPQQDVVPSASDDELRALAQRRIDSLQIQRGEPAGPGLTHTVVHLVKSPTDSVSAFYVITRDADSRGFNPAWWVLDNESGAIGEIDSVTGREEELPRTAAGWTREGRFVYAKGAGIYEARPAGR